MLARLLVAAMCALPLQAFADEPWVYEFEFCGFIAADRLFWESSCTKVIPIQFAEWYAQTKNPGWTISCGNRQPTYTHFLGRRCWKPLPKLVLECGWRHFSSPMDSQELTFDSLAVRGRFSWGKK
jgi:hypothetical protein